MQDDPETRAVAARLTTAQRRALMDARPTGYGGCMAALPTYSPCRAFIQSGTVRNDGTLTPLGRRVRAVLEQEAAP